MNDQYQDSTSRKILSSGQTLFKEGEAGDCAYIVQRGTLELSTLVHGSELSIASVGEGDILGEMALIDDDFRSATAVALTEVELVVVPRAYVQRLLDNSDNTVAMLLKVIVSRYRELMDGLEQVMQGLPLAQRESAKNDTTDMQAQSHVTAEVVEQEFRLQQAIDKQHLELHYQPIVDLQTGRINGCEALIRSGSVETDSLSPEKLIALAEDTGLIEKLGYWIIQQAGGSLADFRTAASASVKPDDFFVSINVSNRQLATELKSNLVAEAFLNSGFDPHGIKLEITESLLMLEPKRMELFLQNLSDHGIRIALDDFGTGYSSFSYLHRFPIHTIKIDRSFIVNMTSNAKSLAIVKALCDMAKAMEITVIAEGIETEWDETMLRDFGCTYGQGYHYSKAIPKVKFIEMLEAQ